MSYSKMDQLSKKPIEGIKDFFSNPLETPLGKKVGEATDASLASENWAINIEICDMINLSPTEEAAKDAVRAIKKRLQQNAGKNYTVIMFTLTVLETCVKNCGSRFHVLVCQKDFVQELVKLIGPKNDPPAIVSEKILGLIQTWADTFKGQPEYSGVVNIYEELKSKGMEFPSTDFDSMAPILTPKRSVESEPPILHQVDFGERQVKLTPEQLVKIRRDLDVVTGNMTVFADMLGELKPDGNSSDLELLDELYSTCKEMQRRIAELVCSVNSDELTEEMLHMNDDLNNLFLRYERLKRNVDKINSPPDIVGLGSQEGQKKTTYGAGRGDAAEPSLIDFGSEDAPGSKPLAGSNNQNLSGRMGNMKLGSGGGPGKKEEDSDFDMFAQSRNATYEKSKESGSSYMDNTNEPLNQGRSLGAAALTRDAEDNMIKPPRPAEETSMTSSEFERFLSDRASASARTASSSSSSNIDKEKTENKMYAL